MPVIFTVGHSTRPLDDFIALLRGHRIELLIDIRTVPRSRKNPQFNKDTLPAALAEGRIRHMHMPELGGLRHPRPDSPNAGWRNDSFRGYADYMQTPEFAAALDRLCNEAAGAVTAVMCAESVPWRCHRNLVADALTVRGVEVRHIMSPTRADPHKLTSFAVVHQGGLLYPKAGQPELF